MPWYWPGTAWENLPHCLWRCAAIDEFSTALLHIREGREERLVVEIAVLRVVRPDVVADIEALQARVGKLEREQRAATPPAPAAPVAEPKQDLPPDRPFTEPGTRNPESGTESEARAQIPESRADSGHQAPEPGQPDAEEDTGDESPVDAAQSDAAERPTEPPDSPEEAPGSELKAQSSEGSFTLTDFNRIWPSVAASIKGDVGPRRHALLREASPTAVERGTVVFEVASHMHFHLEQLKADKPLTEAIVEAAGTQLGQPVRITFRSADAPAIVDPDVEEIPDKGDLEEAPPGDAEDPEAIVTEMLGATLVQDTTSDS